MSFQSEQLNELFSALSKAQGEIKGASKDKVNPFHKSKYADLASIWDACREPLAKNGLSILQTIETNDSGKHVLITTLGHSSGQWIRSKAPLLSKAEDSQGYGSAITYMRRYSLMALVGIAPDDESDDDGEASVGRYEVRSSKKSATPPKEDKVEAIVTKEQAQEISEMLLGFDDLRDNIFKYYKIDSFEKLPAKGFEPCMKRAKENSKKVEAACPF